MYVSYLSAFLIFRLTDCETAFKRSCLDIHRPSVYTLGGCVVSYEGNDKTRKKAATTCASNHHGGHLALVYNQEQIAKLDEFLDLEIPAWCALKRKTNGSDLWIQSTTDIEFQMASPPWDKSLPGNPTSTDDGVVVSEDGMKNEDVDSLHPFLCQFAEPTVAPSEFKQKELDQKGSNNQVVNQWSATSIHVCAETCTQIKACLSFSYSSPHKECHLYYLPANKLNTSTQNGYKIFDKELQDTDCITTEDCAPISTHFLIISGWESNTVESYYPLEPSNGGLIATIDRERHTVDAEWYDGKVLLVGGLSSSVYLKSSIVFNPESNSYTEVAAQMSVTRDRPGAATLHGSVILCGGWEFATSTYLSSCEKFSNYQWQSMPSMAIGRHTLQMVNLHNKIYAMGGMDTSTTYARIVERFDPMNNTWTRLNDLPSNSMDADATVFQGTIVKCGGNLDDSQQCHKYDESNDQWLAMASMHQQRLGFNLLVFNGRLYALWGQHGTTQAFEPSIEVYNSDTDAWDEIAAPLVQDHHYPAAVVV